jgi:Spy/CpxP family protein refolding chaperone
MKHPLLRRWAWLIAALVVLVPLLSAGVALSQPPEPEPREETRLQQRLKRLRARLLRKKIGLSEEKAAKVEAMFVANAERRRDIAARQRDARKELRELFQSDSADEAAFGAALDKLKAAHKELSSLREQELDELATFLTPKEQAKLLRAVEQLQRRLQGERPRKLRR